MKRKAPYDIEPGQSNQDNFSDGSDEQQGPGRRDLGKISTPEEIMNRPKLHIKRANDSEGQKTANPTFRLAQQLNPVAPVTPLSGQLLDAQGKQPVTLQQGAQIDVSKQDVNKSLQAGEIKFSGLFSNGPKPVSETPQSPPKSAQQQQTEAAGDPAPAAKPSGENKDQESSPQKARPTSLFAPTSGNGTALSTNLFSSITTNKPTPGGLFSGIDPVPKTSLLTPAATAPPSGSLNGGLFGTSIFQQQTVVAPQTSIFSNPKTETNTQTTAGSIFGAAPNLFMQSAAPADGKALFGSGPSLLGNTGGSLLFGGQANAAAKKAGSDDEGDDGGDDEQQEESPEIDPAQSKGNYQYEDPYIHLFEKELVKFKKGQSDALEKGLISIEETKVEPKQYLLIYRSHGTRIVQFQGILIDKVVKFKHIGNKEENIAMQLAQLNPDTKKPQSAHIKFSFKKSEDGVEFANLIKEKFPGSFEESK